MSVEAIIGDLERKWLQEGNYGMLDFFGAILGVGEYPRPVPEPLADRDPGDETEGV